MSKRLFFSTSVLLALIALIFHLVGRAHTEDAQKRKAARISAAAKEQIKSIPDPAAVRLSAEARLINRIGLIFTFSCCACMFIALIRREPGAYSIPIMLLLFDVLLQMLL